MATYGKYGWTPEQLERINARRARKGQGELVNTSDMGGYAEQGDSDEKPQAKRKPAFPTDRPSALDQYKGQKGLGERMAEQDSMKDEAEERKKEFAKKFKPAGAMAIEKNVASEAAKLNKRGVGISTPSIQKSYKRITA